MLLADHMRLSGEALFRQRSFVLLVFVPFLALAIWDGEAIDRSFGAFAGDLSETIAIAMVILGQMTRILTVGFVPARTSGRNTHGQVADTLNTSGAYSVCRNPLYLGNVLIYLAFPIYVQHLTLFVVMALTLALYYERIIAAEEKYLAAKFGQPYRDWAAKTPAFFPRLGGWTRPNMVFSVKTVIRREFSSVLGCIVMLYLIELGQELREGAGVDPFWTALLVTALIGAGLARVAKRRGFLDVAGR